MITFLYLSATALTSESFTNKHQTTQTQVHKNILNFMSTKSVLSVLKSKLFSKQQSFKLDWESL